MKSLKWLEYTLNCVYGHHNDDGVYFVILCMMHYSEIHHNNGFNFTAVVLSFVDLIGPVGTRQDCHEASFTQISNLARDKITIFLGKKNFVAVQKVY